LTEEFPKPFIEVIATLPICLHLDDRSFRFSDSDRLIEITTSNEISKDATWIGEAKNMEVSSDKFSHFRFTKFKLKIESKEDNKTEYPLLETYENIIFKVLNRFISACRIALHRHGLDYYFDISQFISPINVMRKPEGDEVAKGVLTFAPNLSNLLPNEPDIAHIKIQSLLDEDIDLSLAFLSDARHSFDEWHLIPALLSSLIALEIKAGDTIRNLLEKVGLSKNEIDDMLKLNRALPALKSYFKMLLPASIELPDDNIFNSCIMARKKRNKVIHKGERNIDENEIEKWMNDIEQMISFCDELNKMEEE